ncbi:MAG: M10 family metallopeptidase C-terminal domain-containing protein [Burkholderiales bacterium]|nr:M10 family metallopeptidase C-terminal domain-containing protein [Nitrosomonas sp.]MCP5273692.1 M10 family metallopeptidase C-terminal domain-containing protein [Burkholderiales bacterium]
MLKPKLSTDEAVNRILDGNKSTEDLDAKKWGEAKLGTTAIITYSFLTYDQAKDDIKVGPDGETQYLAYGMALNSFDRRDFSEALNYITDVTGVAFVEAEEVFGNGGDIDIQKRDGGWGSATSSALGGDDVDVIKSSHVIFADDFTRSHALHEMLHALGLSHPGSYNFNPADPSDVITYEDDADYFQDSHQYTVMSYFSAEETGGSYGDTRGTLMLHDVVALQKLYGFNWGAFSDSTTYGFNSNTNREAWTVNDPDTNMFGAIWDGGGIDTIDASGYTKPSVINLNSEQFSSLNGLSNNLTIAPHAWIEHAIGGYADDRLIGNVLGNRLHGKGGDDYIYGEGGNDLIDGGSGNDMISGGPGRDYLNGGRGNDTVSYSYGGGGWLVDLNTESASSISGPTVERVINFENIIGSKGSDKLFGDNNDNRITGGDGNDLIVGREGNDDLYGAKGNDTISGGPGKDSMNGGSGQDVVDYSYSNSGWIIDLRDEHAKLLNSNGINGLGLGNSLNDNTRESIKNFEDVIGSQGDDRIYGDAGENVLKGKSGDDFISGGPGTDYLDGGDGTDTVSYSYSGGGWLVDLHTERASSINGSTVERVINFENIVGSKGSDELFGDNNGNLIIGGNGNDLIVGRKGNDVLYGSKGNDTISGGLGEDSMYGGSGQDVVDYSYSNSGWIIDLRDEHAKLLNSNGINDFGIYNTNNNTRETIKDFEDVIGSQGNDRIYGDAGENVLKGERGKDYLYGGAGNDHLIGGMGNDGLYGDAGVDIFEGGGGRDSFMFTSFHEMGRIKDFESGVDKIWIYGKSAPRSFGDLEVVDFIGSAAIQVVGKPEYGTIFVDDHMADQLDASDFQFLSW